MDALPRMALPPSCSMQTIGNNECVFRAESQSLTDASTLRTWLIIQSSMESFSPEVIVIGAGAAGLAAAGMLSRAGVRTLVFEARDRVGGRILTMHPSNLNVAVELGAEFVHGRSPASFELIEEGKLTLSEIQGQPFCSNESALGRCDFWSRIEKVLHLMKKEARRDQSFDAFVRSLRDPEISEKDKRAAC